MSVASVAAAIAPKRVETVEPCEGCAHALVEPMPGADNLLCREPGVIRSFGRERVSARLARDEVCHRRRFAYRTGEGARS